MPSSPLEIRCLWLELLSLSVYRSVLRRPVTSALTALIAAAARGDDAALCDGWGNLCALLADTGSLDSLPAAVAGEVLQDANPYTRCLAAGSIPTPSLQQAAERDLDILYRAASLPHDQLLEGADPAAAGLPRWGFAPAPSPLALPWREAGEALAAYHRLNGCGLFAGHPAFLWRQGCLTVVEHLDPIRLRDLKDYEAQRRTAIDNTLAFLDGYEANNMLLYGDRGTGKSSTVKALLNEYADRGLRMVEMPKEALGQLPELTGQLSHVPMKFIVFIDDLSFSGNDDHFAALKAALEGGLAARPANVLIYATSNRRHLLRETFSDRQGDEIHHADTVQEAVSLSDRFGISLTFLLPDKQHFLQIVEQIARDRGLQVERQTLLDAAERWALDRGGRSPRYARQFIADAEARLGRGESL